MDFYSEEKEPHVYMPAREKQVYEKVSRNITELGSWFWWHSAETNFQNLIWSFDVNQISLQSSTEALYAATLSMLSFERYVLWFTVDVMWSSITQSSQIMSASISLQQDVSVAYLGPPGTFSHQAAYDRFGDSVAYVPQKQISGIWISSMSGMSLRWDDVG